MEEEDAMAEFLAREQAILGADAALFGNPLGAEATDNSKSPQSLLHDIDQLVPDEKPLSATSANGTLPMSPPVLHNVTATNGIKSPDLMFEQTPEAVAVTPVSQALIDWQIEFDAKVQERDAKEKEKHERMLTEAKEALERFYAEYNEKKVKGVKKNKELEAQLIAQRDAKGGNIWERIAKQIEVPPAKPSTEAPVKKQANTILEEKKAAKKTNNETMRFKQVINSLKMDSNAPGLVN